MTKAKTVAVRKLSVEEFDCRYRKPAKSMLRIKGRWLTAAGFPPHAAVELTVISPGVIEIRLLPPPQLRDEHFQQTLNALTRATARAAGRQSNT